MFGLSEASVVIVIVTLLGGGGVGVILKFVLDKRQAPISEAQVLSAMAAQTSSSTIAWGNELQEDIARYRAEGVETRRQFEEFRSQVRGQLNRWENWYACEVVARWGELRKSETPPLAPANNERVHVPDRDKP